MRETEAWNRVVTQQVCGRMGSWFPGLPLTLANLRLRAWRLHLCLCHPLGILQLSLGDALGFPWLWPPGLCWGADGPVGRPGVRRVHAALLFLLSFRRLPVENVILSLEALAFGSATRQIPLGEPTCVTWGSAGPQLRISGLVNCFKRGFYSMTGNFSHHVISELANWWFQQSISASGKSIQFELVVMAATLNTAVNFCQRANAWNRELQKTWSPECFSRFWPQATENELKSSWLSPRTFFDIIFC